MKKSSFQKEGFKKGSWTSQEDKLLSDYIRVHGVGKWRTLPLNAGLNRCGKSCRLRWLNYLRPDIKRGNFSEEEEDLIIRLHKLLGNRWSLIAGRLPGRTDNEIKNYWNTCLRKKLTPESSEQQSSAITKEASTEKPNAKNQTENDVNVIRTKAVRCTRPVFVDQLPTVHNDTVLTTPPDSDPLLAFNRQSAFPQTNAYMDANWMAELMQKDSFYDTGIDGLQSVGNAEFLFAEDNYRTEWMNTGMNGGGGLFSFLDQTNLF